MDNFTSTSWYIRRLCGWTTELEREVKPKIVVVGVHNQTETLAEGWFQVKTVLRKIVEGRAGEWPAGKGKKLIHLLRTSTVLETYQS